MLVSIFRFICRRICVYGFNSIYFTEKEIYYYEFIHAKMYINQRKVWSHNVEKSFEWKPTNFIFKIQCLLAHLTYLFQLLNNSVRDMTHEERVISPIWAKWEKIWKHEMRETRSRCGVEYIYFNPTLFWPNTFWQPPILKRNYSNLVLVVDVFC